MDSYTKEKRPRQNRWIEYLKIMKNIFNEFPKQKNSPNRFQLAREIYWELVNSGQINDVIKYQKLPKRMVDKIQSELAVKPTERLQNYICNNVGNERKIKEKPIYGEFEEMEPILSLEGAKRTKREFEIEEIQKKIEERLKDVQNLLKTLQCSTK